MKLRMINFELFFSFSLCLHLSSSDFNVIIPEICQLPQNLRVNLSWIHEMVHLGIRDEQSPIKLNILRSEEICDGSGGILKFISLAHSNPSGTIIASLEPHSCTTAASAAQLMNEKLFISWTCPNIPGAISLKPDDNEVISAIHKLLNYFNWKTVGLVKYRADKSSYCEELWEQLEGFLAIHSEINTSVVILGNYEELDNLSLYSSATSSINGMFLCVSYGHGLEESLSRRNDKKYKNRSFKSKYLDELPLVLVPEWPLPMDLISPHSSSFGLITNPHPFPPSSSSSSSYEFIHSKNNEEGYGQNNEPTLNPISLSKIIETLLAQMILKSVKIGIELRKIEEIPPSKVPFYTTEHNWNYESSSTTLPSSSHYNMARNYHKFKSQEYTRLFDSKLSFYFSLAQYEKWRWHPLINLSNGDRPLSRRKPEKEQVPKNVLNSPPQNKHEILSAELLTWIQILLALILIIIIIVIVACLSIYSRNRSRGSGYGSGLQRKISRRNRSQGPYKILLTSSDIVFGSHGVGLASDACGRKLRVPFVGSRGETEREEKPDLLKVPHGSLRKGSMGRSDSVQCFPGDNKARYKVQGDLVHLRKLGDSSDALQIKMKTMNVLETLHGIRHENVAAMLGCLTEPRPALVWEYCSRGSLFEILQQNDIKLDWAFKLSLLTDLVRGMRHLHLSFVKVHGNLTSNNCVIDARWVLKITDYGLSALNSAQGFSPLLKRPKDLLWTAPELLRDEVLRKTGSQAGDVFSFAIIMQEVLVRGEPYCMLTLSPSEILEKLKHPPPLIRPSVSKGVAPPEAINIMRQCWAELPDMRPDFSLIHDLFKTLNHGRKANIVDTMFQMLEKYSNNLEELIRERTEQLDLEKKKTEQLLNRMLPSMVADKLKLGLPVDPEEFSDVTIYFSDIVGFTTISAYSTPFEVVDLLNDLYTCFDATINDYNVYKVETIGDAYMVVGGAPVWSRDHVDQIATMALDLLHQSGKFRIRHLPYTPLRLRIGLHTGPCCAGVVGLTMPRYCLFGDTVNTASRMESSGGAWRIHISGETKARLDAIGGYLIQYRGMTAIKGKGQMPTFWLLGKEGFDKELPKTPGLNDSCYLDEKSIIYGRTGVWPDSNLIGNEFADPNTTSPLLPITDSSNGTPEPSNNSSTQRNSNTISTTNVNSVPKKHPVLHSHLHTHSTDTLRTLSPAEQVAHELLNGKPAVRGLRRQFSLDQGTSSHPLQNKSSFRKAPSLEENSEYIYSTSAHTSFDRSASMKETNLNSSHSQPTNFSNSQTHLTPISPSTNYSSTNLLTNFTPSTNISTTTSVLTTISPSTSYSTTSLLNTISPSTTSNLLNTISPSTNYSTTSLLNTISPSTSSILTTISPSTSSILTAISPPTKNSDNANSKNNSSTSSPNNNPPINLLVHSSNSQMDELGRSGESLKPILKSRALSVLEESPVLARKNIPKTN